MNQVSEKENFFQGVKAAMPIAVGYIPIAIAFGLLSKSVGIPSYVSFSMSLLIYAGASQFIGINLIVLGASWWEIVVTTFILNLRHFLMTATLSQKLEKRASRKWRMLLSFGITDETFSVSSFQSQEILPRYFSLGLNTMAFVAWNVGTWLGLFCASGLPDTVKSSMGIALYVMFIGLLIPQVKKSKSALVVSILAIIINSLSSWLSLGGTGWGIIIATIFSAAIGAKFFTREESE
ncbi:4-azaleucine resistance transporter AzlC [Sporomusaceae bacterium BoRhaA]|uniref:AzlC family ABC transporter permease n=1 Tax=Pelorhabdus rhamnosifermentans TaxID=2772457 RepID=UPI001C06231D|nr:AzlC family ABC transporter permease [Pelorhabdus rhamnosifermentans]MBU2700011.1 4-azaleucine resistance transporter AzlC [Pelorhabdus rhamnosifermentans]